MRGVPFMVKVRFVGACALGAIVLGSFGLGDRSAAQDVDPAELVKDIHAIFGEHHARAVHAKGVVLEANFEPTDEARQLSKAAAFAGKLQATVRLSNTTGIPDIPDADPNASPQSRSRVQDRSAPMLRRHPVNGRSRNVEPLRNGSRFVTVGQCSNDRFAIHCRWTAFVPSVSFCLGDTFQLPLPTKISLEFGYRSKHIEHQSAGGRGCVDALLGHDEVDAFGL
jgi:hypothetical protein